MRPSPVPAETLADGLNTLKDGGSQLTDGVTQLDDGAQQLAEGMNEFKTEAIDKLMDLYHDDLEGLMDRFDAIIDAGRGYNSFTGLTDNMEGNVKFVYRTEGIESDEN